MSYRRYELPRQPRTPLDDTMRVLGIIGLVSVALLVGILLWCSM